MAEFADIMRHYRRFCEERSRIAAENNYDYHCKNCPLEHNDVCSTFAAGYTDEGVAEFEVFLTKWAEEHPEPVYPTWYEYLWHNDEPSDYTQVAGFYAWMRSKNIPADIAQKLGLKPKEG